MAASEDRIRVPATRTLAPDASDLVLQHQALVRSLAWKIGRKLPPSVDLEDLVSFGYVGLTEAACNFDSARGCKFTTYAYHRIRGAIFDGLAKMSWFRLPEYHASRYEHLANDLLERSADDAAGTTSAGIEGDAAWLKGIATTLVIAQLALSGIDDIALVDEFTPSPAAEAGHRELRGKLRELMEILPGDGGSLVRSLYFDSLTLKEAGQRIGISESWASRLHSKTLQRLAHALRLLGIGEADA